MCVDVLLTGIVQKIYVNIQNCTQNAIEYSTDL